MKNLAVLIVVALLAGGAFATIDPTFTDSFGDFTSNQADGWGTTFTPGKATLDPTEIEVPQTVYLQDWTYGISSSGSGLQDTEIYLAVFSETDPGAQGTENLLGVSTNSLNLLNVYNQDPSSLITWSFANVALDSDTEYAMMFSSTADGLSKVAGGVELEVGNPYVHGGWIRVNNVANDWDPDFVATYSMVPEPATLMMLGIGGAFLARRKK